MIEVSASLYASIVMLAIVAALVGAGAILPWWSAIIVGRKAKLSRRKLVIAVACWAIATPAIAFLVETQP